MSLPTSIHRPGSVLGPRGPRGRPGKGRVSLRLEGGSRWGTMPGDLGPMAGTHRRVTAGSSLGAEDPPQSQGPLGCSLLARPTPSLSRPFSFKSLLFLKKNKDKGKKF